MNNMADLCFTAQTATKQSIVANLGQLSFQRNDSVQYNKANITQLEKGIQRVLKQQYNPAGGSNGMLNLLNHNKKRPQPNMTATAAGVLHASKKEVDDELAQKGTTVAPKITLRSNAQDETNRRNIVIQALIGAKEGVLEALTTFSGINITNTVLWQVDGD